VIETRHRRRIHTALHLERWQIVHVALMWEVRRITMAEPLRIIVGSKSECI
jgi:hypothetical protein